MVCFRVKPGGTLAMGELLGLGLRAMLGHGPLNLSLEAVLSKANREVIMISGHLMPGFDFLQISGSQCCVQPWLDFS